MFEKVCLQGCKVVKLQLHFHDCNTFVWNVKCNIIFKNVFFMIFQSWNYNFMIEICLLEMSSVILYLKNVWLQGCML